MTGLMTWWSACYLLPRICVVILQNCHILSSSSALISGASGSYSSFWRSDKHVELCCSIKSRQIWMIMKENERLAAQRQISSWSMTVIACQVPPHGQNSQPAALKSQSVLLIASFCFVTFYTHRCCCLQVQWYQTWEIKENKTVRHPIFDKKS